MTQQEEIQLAEKQVEEAETLLKVRRADVVYWENLLKMRQKWLLHLKLEEPVK